MPATSGPLASASATDGHWTRATIRGQGDDVLRLATPANGLETAAFTHTGSENFIVQAFSDDGMEPIVNEIGHYHGQVQLPDGTFLLQITASGAWTATRN